MSELKVNKISPRDGTAFTLGDSGDTFTVPAGANIVNSGTATGFGGGAWNVISSGTLSGVSELIITGITGAFRIYLVIPAYSGSSLRATLSNDGGSSFRTGGSDYAYAGLSQNMDRTGSFGNGSATTAYMSVGYPGNGLTTIDVSNPEDASNETHVRSDSSYVISSSNGAWHRTHSMNNTAEVNNAIRIYPSSGTLTGNYKVLDLN